MSMGNFCGTSNTAKAATKLHQGEIVSAYRKYLNNNDVNSSYFHGMLKYLAQSGSVEMMEYYTKQNNLNIGDTVTFTLSQDKQALNPYANGVTKYDFTATAEMKQQPQNDDYSNSNREVTKKNKKAAISASKPHTNNVNVYNFEGHGAKQNKNGTSSTVKRQNKRENKRQSPVRLICISDTHNSHNKLTKHLTDIYRSESDILVHCGDMTDRGSVQELKAVNKWFGKLPYKHIIVTAGNMDGIGLDKSKHGGNNGYGRGSSRGYGGYFDKDDDDDTNMLNNGGSKQSLGHSIFTNAIYLEHESYHLQEYNLRFFASPYSMRFYGGYQVNSEKEAKSLWKQVPNDTDILICHGPPADILDATSSGKRAGDKVLLNHVVNRIQPKVMLFGHMHSSYGYKEYKGIHFYNCAQDNALNGRHHGGYSSYYGSSNKKSYSNIKPHVIDLSKLA